MKNLFAYGTLMCEDIMLEVAGYCPNSPESHSMPLVCNSASSFGHTMPPSIIPCPDTESRGVVRGILKGYSRRSIKGEVYPALVPDEKGMVEGILYKDIPDEAWDRLDCFEGEMYSRQSVMITLPDETTVPAETYVIRPEFLHYLEEKEWDFEDFLRHHKIRFQREYG